MADRPFELKFVVSVGDALAQIKGLTEAVAQTAKGATELAQEAKGVTDGLNTISETAGRNAETIAAVTTAAQGAVAAQEAEAAAAGPLAELLASEASSRASLSGSLAEETVARTASTEARVPELSLAREAAILRAEEESAANGLSLSLSALAQAQQYLAEIEAEEGANAEFIANVRRNVADYTQQAAAAERAYTQLKQAAAAASERLAAAEKQAADAARYNAFGGKAQEFGTLLTTLGLVEPSLLRAGVGLQIFGQAVETIGPKVAAAGGGVAGFVSTLGPLLVVGAAATIALAGIAKAAGLVKEAISEAATQQTAETGFLALLGSTQAAQQRLEELDATAEKFNLPTEQVRAASQELTLLSQGALGTGKSLELVIEGSARTGQSLTSVATSFGRAYEAIQNGQPIQRATQQLQRAGLISGSTANELKNMAAAGKSGSEIWAALEKSLDQYGGAAAAFARTFAGVVQGIRTAWQQMMETFGRPIVNGLTPFLQAVKDVLTALKPEFTAAGYVIGAFLKIAGDGLQVVAAIINGDFASAATHLRDLLTSAAPIVSAACSLISNLVKAAFYAVQAAMDGLGVAIVQALAATFQDAVNQAVSFVKTIMGVLSAIPGAGGIASSVNSAVDTAAAGLFKGTDYIVKTAQGMVDGAIANMRNAVIAAGAAALQLGLGVIKAQPGSANDDTKINPTKPGKVLPDKKPDTGGKDNNDLEARRALLEQLSKLESQYQSTVKLTDVELALGEKSPAEAAQKNIQTIQTFLVQLAALQKQLEAEQTKLTAQPQTPKTVADLEKIKAAVAQVILKQKEMNLEAAKLTPLGNIRVQLTQLANGFTDLAKVAGNAAREITTTITNGISNAITGLITRTKTLGQAFAEVGQSIIAMLVKIVVEYVAGRLIMAAIDALTNKQANQGAIQSASQLAVASAPAAINMAIATEGAAVGIGSLAYGAALAGATAASAAAGSYRSGGYTGDGHESEVAGVVHRGEYVFPKSSVLSWGVENLRALSQARMNVRVPRLSSDARGAMASAGGYSPTGRASGPRSRRGEGGTGGGDHHHHTYVFFDQDAMMRHMRSKKGTKVILDAITGNRVELGIP